MILDLERFLPYRLNRLASVVSDRLRHVYRAKYELTVPEWRVFATLGQFEEMTAKAVGLHSAMHKTKVSRAVRALEERRWLARRENPHDRREELLTLTAQGRKAYGAVIPDMQVFENELRGVLGSRRMSDVTAALDLLETALGIARRDPGKRDAD